MSAVLAEKPTFTTGMLVEFVNPDGYIEREYGKGPFQIVCVHKVPIWRCNCEGGHFGADGNLQGHIYECPKYNQLSVGHHQWVIVLMNGVEERFSGKYFKPVTTSEKS